MPRIAVCSFRRFGCIPGEQGDAGLENIVKDKVRFTGME